MEYFNKIKDQYARDKMLDSKGKNGIRSCNQRDNFFRAGSINLELMVDTSIKCF